MKLRALIPTLLLALPLAAVAQSSLSNPYRYPSLRSPTYSAPNSSSTYDWRSGNRYTMQRNFDGSTSVRGSNLNTGSQWRTTVQPNGDMRGVDKDGNYWRYNSSSKGLHEPRDGNDVHGPRCAAHLLLIERSH